MKFLANLPPLSQCTAVSPLRQRRFRRLAQVLAPALALALPWAIAMPTESQRPAQQPAPQSAAQPAQQPAPQPAAPQARPDPEPPKSSSFSGEVTEESLKRELLGKPLFLRGGYLGDNIAFNEHGAPAGHPVVGSYTLSGVQIDRVRLTKRKVELEGSRYALHFLGALPSEDPDKAVDRVKITPKKKVLRITIDREQIVKPKKVKEPKESAKDKGKKAAKPGPAKSGPATTPVASSETDVAAPQTPAASPATTQPGAEAGQKDEKDEKDEKEDPADQAADQASVTTTISPAHAAQVLHEALEKIFAPGLDDSVRALMPQFWQLYYKAQAAGTDYRPSDPNVLRSNAVDQQAKVLTSIAPDSNEYAQASGIAGRALYRAVIGADGKPGEIAVIRPIGFGLDEKAVEAIRKATFQAAQKSGQPVAETLDLAVLFRIYSKRTAGTAAEEKTADTVKPGPYTIRAKKAEPEQPQAAPEAQPASQSDSQPASQPEAPPAPKPDPQPETAK